ncbi:MAG: glycosyltransferase [Chitinophagaceae bacterium]|nr:glycosyltransferase [Chitinophagaceae bacterium]
MAIFLLIFLVLLLIYSFLIDFYRRGWKGVPIHKIEPSNDIKVSVIIAVRNEEDNIPGLLKCLNEQDYPKDKYEVIIADDSSTDNTFMVVSNIYFDYLSKIALKLEGSGSKKEALQACITVASGEMIIATDADCRMGSSWISAYVSFYKKTGAQCIAAPVKMDWDNSLLQIFQTLDFLAMQAITGASVSRRFHTMCNGANFAYTKQAFIEVNGFEGIDRIPSGDDMLLMHKISVAYPGKVMYMKNPESVVFTKAESSWKSFFHQRIRWASKAVHYKDRKIFYALVLTYLVNVCYLILGIASFFDVRWLSFFLLLLIAKILIEFPFINAAAIFFNQQQLMKFFPFLQPLHILYVIIAGWFGRFGSYVWKSRTIKNSGSGNLVKQ